MSKQEIPKNFLVLDTPFSKSYLLPSLIIWSLLCKINAYVLEFHCHNIWKVVGHSEYVENDAVNIKIISLLVLVFRVILKDLSKKFFDVSAHKYWKSIHINKVHMYLKTFYKMLQVRKIVEDPKILLIWSII